MSETFSSQFQKNKGEPISFDGIEVRPIFTKKLEKSICSMVIHRIKAKKEPVQGVRMKVIKGKINVNGVSYPEMIFWADTSPETVNIIITSKDGCELKVWNVWRADGLIQAWVGNSGLSVESHNNKIKLLCSDGTGEPNFSDLIIDMEIFMGQDHAANKVFINE